MPVPAKKATPAKKAPAKKAPAKKAPAKKAAASTAVVPAAPVKASARALSMFEEKFAKRFGQNAMRSSVKRAYRVVSTGSITLDQAMGCGGYVVGRVTEIWGQESVAKSTISLIAAGNFQAEFPHRLVAWIDIERTYDPEWAEANGVDLDRIKIFYPDTSEDVSDQARMIVESGLFSLVVLDSVGGMITNEEMDKNDADKASVGTAAKVITRMVKQAAVLCERTETTMIIVNQTRSILSHSGGNTTGGGWALKHVTTHKIRLRKTSTEPYTVGTGDYKETVGMEIAATVEKNKVAPPKRVATFAIFNQTTAEYGPIGIDRAREAFIMGRRFGIIENPTQGYYLLPGDEKPTHGEAKTLVRLREDTALLDKIRRDMLARIADQVADEIPEEADADEVMPADAPPPLPGHEMPQITAGESAPPVVDGVVLSFSGSAPEPNEDEVRMIEELRDNENAAARATEMAR